MVTIATAFSVADAGAREQVSDDPAQTDAYLVAPFENAGKVAQIDWMASALAVTLAEKMEVHPRLRPAYGPQILDGMPRAFDAEKVAQRAHDLGAKWVFSGSFARPNWKSEIRVQLYVVIEPSQDIPKRTLLKVLDIGDVAERGAPVDQLEKHALEILKQMKWTLDAESLSLFKRRATKDLYAFTLWGRAMNLYYGYSGARDLKQAEKILKKACLINPKFAEAHRALGLVYLEMGERAKASSQYSYALDLKPGYHAAMIGLARFYRAESQRARAQELVEKALELRPWDVDAREMLGELLWENGELDASMVELTKVVAVQPRHLAARRTLALVYAARGATENLATELERVQDLAPEDVDVKLDLGSAYQRMGAHEKAIAVYEDVIKRQPRNAQAHKMLGDCYRRMGEPLLAIGAYQRVMKLAPDDPRPYFLLGAAYEESGQEGKAEQVFQDAQQFRRYLGEAWANLGSLAFRKGDLSKANWYLSRAVVKSPMRPKAHYNYALVLSAKKDRDKALDELRIAGDLDPQDADIHYLSGVILIRQGRLDEAKKEFQEALKRRADHPDAKHNLALLEDLEKRYGGERVGVGAR